MAVQLAAMQQTNASQEPRVTVGGVTPGSRRRRLAAAALLVTAIFAPGDAAAAQQLGRLVQSEPDTVLPPGTFGQVTVSNTRYNGADLPSGDGGNGGGDGQTPASPPPDEQAPPSPPPPSPEVRRGEWRCCR